MARVDTVPLLRYAPAEEAARKVREIRRGAHLLREFPVLPKRRQNQNRVWAAGFCVACVALVLVALWSSGSVWVFRGRAIFCRFGGQDQRVG